MKLTKLSIAAALAVSCISAANAKPLAEAIKNVDVSGTVAYRYNDYEGTSAANNNYKIATTLKSKVNDDITFNSRVIIGDGKTAPASLSTNGADSEAKFALSEANFSYTGVENLTITAGKQGVATPFTVARDSIGGETTGTGILAVYSMNPVTFAGGYFNQTSLFNGKDIYTVGANASFGGINADAWYIDADETADAYTVGLNASYKVADIALNPSIRYSEQDNDTNNNEVSTLKVEIGASTGIFDAYVAYGETGKDAGVAIDGYSSDTTLDPHWRVGLLGQADTDVIFANVGAQISDKVHVSLKHSNLDAAAANSDEKETYGQVVYKMSSNFFTYVRLGEYKKEGSDASKGGRLHIQYSF